MLGKIIFQKLLYLREIGNINYVTLGLVIYIFYCTLKFRIPTILVFAASSCVV